MSYVDSAYLKNQHTLLTYRALRTFSTDSTMFHQKLQYATLLIDFTVLHLQLQCATLLIDSTMFHLQLQYATFLIYSTVLHLYTICYGTIRFHCVIPTVTICYVTNRFHCVTPTVTINTLLTDRGVKRVRFRFRGGWCYNLLASSVAMYVLAVNQLTFLLFPLSYLMYSLLLCHQTPYYYYYHLGEPGVVIV